MFRPRVLATSSLALGIVLSFSQSASAAFTAGYTGLTGLGGTIKYSVNNSVGATGGAGLMNWNMTGGTGLGGQTSGNFSTFCIQLQNLNNPSTFTIVENQNLHTLPTPGGGMGTTAAARLRELFARRIDAGGFAGAFMTGINLAAFQFAVWEIVYEGNGALNVTEGSGNFSIFDNVGANANSNDVVSAITLANTWLSQLNGSLTTSLVGLDSGPNNGQDQVSFDSDRGIVGEAPDVEAVPAPPAVILAGLGVVSMLGLRARRMAARKAIA